MHHYFYVKKKNKDGTVKAVKDGTDDNCVIWSKIDAIKLSLHPLLKLASDPKYEKNGELLIFVNNVNDTIVYSKIPIGLIEFIAVTPSEQIFLYIDNLGLNTNFIKIRLADHQKLVENVGKNVKAIITLRNGEIFTFENIFNSIKLYFYERLH